MARSIPHRLYLSELDDLGLAAALHALCEDFARRENMTVDTHPTGATARVTRASNLETTDCRIYNANVDGVDLVAVRIREAIWFEKLQKARKAFSVSSANVRALKTEHQSLPPSDGHYAYGQALVSEMNARIEYDRVSRIFRHIALWGSLPD